MQILITDGTLARNRVLHLRRWQLVAGAAVMAVILLLVSGAVYHYLFLKAAREGWPVVSQLVRWVVRDDLAQRERFMHENLDAMAQRVGEMQARLVTLQMMGDRVSKLAGLKAEDLRPAADAASAPLPDSPGARGGRGGPASTLPRPSNAAIDALLTQMDASAALNADVFTLVESRLMEQKLEALMVPSSAPADGPVGSGFGFRYDPFDGHRALHTGLDFPSPVGTPVLAAAGGVVLSVEQHAEYGTMLTLDHGNGLLTRYAHLSRVDVQVGDIVRRRQPVAAVGSTGRSTGPHLHFEVLVQGVPQNPARFLAGKAGPRVIN